MIEIVLKLFKDLLSEVRQGFLFFGGPFDIVTMILDVAITTALFYFILKLLRETRAWQLLKGVVFLILVGQILSLLGMQAISFLLNTSLSFLALTLLVLFQPELRKALETLGRNSLNFMQSLPFDSVESAAELDKTIEAIAVACERMSKTYTGALILVERQTKLGEILEKEQAVLLEADLTATMLEQIFYKGSPLHDGACVIRGNKVYAARCHVPLAETYRLKKNYGTRHRAAIGASEISDAISIVCSEEKGTISVALDGSLFSVRDTDVLRALLYRLLAGAAESKEDSKHSLVAEIKNYFKKRVEPSFEVFEDFKEDKKKEDKNAAVVKVQAAETTANARLTLEQPIAADLKASDKELGAAEKESLSLQSADKEEAELRLDTANIAQNLAIAGLVEEVKQANTYKKQKKTLSRLGKYRKWSHSKSSLKFIALTLAVCVWIYVQATTNPVSNKRFNVNIAVDNQNVIEEYQIDYRLSTWNTDIVLTSRERTLNDLATSDILASVDFAKIDEQMLDSLATLSNSQQGSVRLTLPINVQVPKKAAYSYRISSATPPSVEIIFMPLVNKAIQTGE